MVLFHVHYFAGSLGTYDITGANRTGHQNECRDTVWSPCRVLFCLRLPCTYNMDRYAHSLTA